MYRLLPVVHYKIWGMNRKEYQKSILDYVSLCCLPKRSAPSFCFLPVGHKYTNVPWAKAVYVPRAIKRCFFTENRRFEVKNKTLYCPRDINGVFARGTLYIIMPRGQKTKTQYSAMPTVNILPVGRYKIWDINRKKYQKSILDYVSLSAAYQAMHT